MAPPARSRRLAAAALLGMAPALAAPSIARAAGPCPIRLAPDTAAAPWKEAVARAAARLARLDSPHDCRAVDVIVGPDGGATLAFVTTDGRGAARALEAPADLAPALEALLVTLPPPRAPSPPPPREPSPATSVPVQAPTATLPPAPPRPDLHLLLGASAGGRLVWLPFSHASPAFSFRASVLVDHWEIGVVADYAPVHRPLVLTPPDGFALSTFAAGFTFGRRASAAGASFGYGTTLTVQSASEEATDIPAVASTREIDTAHPRFGLYGKVAYPERARVRFTTELGLDAVLGSLRDKAARQRQLPALSRFGVALSVGVEAAVL